MHRRARIRRARRVCLAYALLAIIGAVVACAVVAWAVMA